jgi:folylpolyglutamate synthase
VIGLYTSPHLVAVRERIRINGAPLPEDGFAKYFFEIWDKLIVNHTVCRFARAHYEIRLRHHL